MSDMIKVTDNFGEAAKLFDRIARKAGNTVVLMGKVAGIMALEVEENFAKEGRPNKWKPLAAATIRARRRKGNWPGKILQQRGRLATSFQTKWDNNTAVCGTNVKYAAIQHFGGTTKHAARMRVMHFDQRTSGRMTHGRPGKNVDHFAKPGKAKYGMKVQGKAYSATIPARPILYIGPGGIQKMIAEGTAWIRSAWI
jgi:phage virion morphogenesis protein